MSIAETIPPEVDVEMARRFLQLVDANDTFTFQTFHDRQKGAEEDRALARVIPGPAGKNCSTFTIAAPASTSPSIGLTALGARVKISPTSAPSGRKTMTELR